MASIGIIGAAGCGKTTLARQLSALNCAPYIPEGELGIFPKRILSAIANRNDTTYHFNWFRRQFEKRIVLSNKISKLNNNCFIECCKDFDVPYRLSESIEKQEILRKKCPLLTVDVDVKVLLVTSREKYKELIAKRGRSYEQNDGFLNWSVQVQDKFIQTFAKQKNVLVLRRGNYDFYDYDDLKKVNAIILNFAKKHLENKH